MTQPLPFPVSNASDLSRAIRYVSKHDDTDAGRRYVVNRAKSLGHVDMIPGHWSEQQQQRAFPDSSLEKQFLEQSHRHGISVARLKCVYFRGVEEFQENNLDIGSADMWALVRVQRYINAVRTGDWTVTQDSDLCDAECDAEHVDIGIDLSILSSSIIRDIVYSDASRLPEIFTPGIVETVVIGEDTLQVFGTLNEEGWRYDLDLTSGAHDLVFLGYSSP